MTEERLQSADRLHWRRQVELFSEELVTLADKTLSERRMNDLRRSMRTAQLANFLGVAQEASGLATVRNWVMYQMGRRETSRAWRDSGFGEDVLKDLEAIKEYARTIVTQTAPEIAGDDEHRRRQLLRDTQIALVRLYAGYLRRWFVARGGQG